MRGWHVVVGCVWIRVDRCLVVWHRPGLECGRGICPGVKDRGALGRSSSVTAPCMAVAQGAFDISGVQAMGAEDVKGLGFRV